MVAPPNRAIGHPSPASGQPTSSHTCMSVRRCEQVAYKIFQDELIISLNRAQVRAEAGELSVRRHFGFGVGPDQSDRPWAHCTHRRAHDPVTARRPSPIRGDSMLRVHARFTTCKGILPIVLFASGEYEQRLACRLR